MTNPIAPLMHTDAYKLDHRRQYPPGTTRVYSNYTNRKSRIPGIDHVVHFGLQAYIQKYLMDEFEIFFDTQNEDYICDAYVYRMMQVLGSETALSIGSSHIRRLHQLGYLPLRFCAVPEGTPVPIRVPSFTVENTHPEFAWLTNYVETGLSAGIWQPSTSATIAHEYRKVLLDAAVRTGGSPDDVDWQLHDFSYRGMSSHESAAMSGAAHLLSFRGTDSLVSLDWIDRYYGGLYTAGSIPATEHSVMSAGTAVDGELETYERLLDLYPTGNVAIVSDTYDLWRVLTEYLPKLKDKIMARDGKLVIRPDSGDPETILCGNPYTSPATASHDGVVTTLWDTFGGTTNSKKFWELNPHVGVIYGDSITLDRARAITTNLENQGYASTNVTFGVGSFTYQYQTRDTFGSAMKATWAEINGKGVELYKDPVTDDGTKRSARGRLAVRRGHQDLFLIERASEYAESISELQPIWENGQFLRHQSFEDVRKVLNGG